jgi:hypothetical protein
VDQGVLAAELIGESLECCNAEFIVVRNGSGFCWTNGSNKSCRFLKWDLKTRISCRFVEFRQGGNDVCPVKSCERNGFVKRDERLW